MPSDPISDLSKLSKPATVLIEKISDAIGGIFRPYQIKRIAQAEAEANLIKAKSEIEITELQNRAVERFIAEESKKQENIENITNKAIPLLSDNSNPGKIEDDWITNFFDKSRIISNDEMQRLWAKVLAGEANSPGAFSTRTVNFLSTVSKRDAAIFNNMCRFIWNIGGPTALIYNVDEDIYVRNGVNFGTLSHLDSIGLLKFDNITTFVRKGIHQSFFIDYKGKPYLIFPKKKDYIQSGKVLLTEIGDQLSTITEVQPIKGYEDYVIEKFKSMDVGIASICQHGWQ